MNGIANRLALVTGGTGFIGSAICLRLAEEGARVLVGSRQLKRSEIWVRDNEEYSEHLFPLEIDLSNHKKLSSTLTYVHKKYGTPTILVANASHRDGLSTPIKEITHEQFFGLTSVDVAGHFICARQIADLIDVTTDASIIWISSIYALAGTDQSIYGSGIIGTPPQYAATKSAQLGLVRYLAALWGNRRIRVNGIVAGGVRNRNRQTDEFAKEYSGKTMLGRMAEAKEVAGAVAFLASEDSSYITGECMAVDGGYLGW